MPAVHSTPARLPSLRGRVPAVTPGTPLALSPIAFDMTRAPEVLRNERKDRFLHLCHQSDAQAPLNMEEIKPNHDPNLDFPIAAHKASALAGQLPDIVIEAQRLSQDIRNGAHSMRKSGDGDLFWQHRMLQSGKAMTHVDWRRSARSENLFVREFERVSPQHIWIWFDLSASMHYKSQVDFETKAECVLILGLALADIAACNGDFVGIPGLTNLMRGQKVTTRFCEVLQNFLISQANSTASNPSEIPSQNGTLFLLSDFWQPASAITRHIKQLSTVQNGVLARVLDPAEQAISYQDRTRFIDSESGHSLLVDDPSDLQNSFDEKYQEHYQALKKLSNTTGWPLLTLETSSSALNNLAMIIQANNEGV